jgi:hypothetical protein
MASAKVKTAKFGPTHSGLTTVGYVLRDGNGNVFASRTTGGVTEILDGNGNGTGNYQALITLPDLFAGTLTWDTGTGATYTETINPNDTVLSSIPR